ncbi:hypothetical protein NDN08_000045 [Rhodosorus marinus]|uniref:non-specific serine/threonine protein kinase n=1 Tax=Rhodosorus marinus TaxID=101924 RepID=A0AAV8UFE5_9RHOD|nr:hypothetical protein NDN08_000045 [Rhodosorus marinus]
MAKVGPYIVTETLGTGTFGKVKLAKHKETNVEYAIKILDKKDIKEQELTINVRREIAIMKALNHENIVNLREVLSSKHKLYIVMDLVRGGELFEMIEKKGELDEKTARKYFQQLVDGIEYCHRRGVFHRDLKPENLLLDENGILKITDFGVSSVKKREGDMLFTAVGTPYYCAPEILLNSPQGYNGEKVDTWSCGVILYLLLVGDLPFQHDEMNVLYEMIKQCKVIYPSSLSPGAKDMLSKMLVKEADKRYTLVDVKMHPWFRVDYVPVNGSSVGSGLGEDNGSRNDVLKNRSGASLPPVDENRRSGELLTGNIGPAQLVNRLEGLGNGPALRSGSGSRKGSKGAKELARAGSGTNKSSAPPEEANSPAPNRMTPGVSPISIPRGPASPGAPPKHQLSSPMHPQLERGYAEQQQQPSPQVAVGPPMTAQPAPPPPVEHRAPPPPKVAVIAPKYEGKDMLDFVRDALPGKPQKKLEDVVAKLSEVDIDCVEDVQAVADTTATPEELRKWLEKESALPAVTSMRITKMFFS